MGGLIPIHKCILQKGSKYPQIAEREDMDNPCKEVFAGVKVNFYIF